MSSALFPCPLYMSIIRFFTNSREINVLFADQVVRACFDETDVWSVPNPSGRAPALTLAGYAPCDRAPPEMHPLKMFEILGHPHFQQLHGHKIPMNATNSPDRLNLYIFSLNLSYQSFVSVHDIQLKRLLNKISVYAFTHPGGHHRVANAMLFVACTRDVIRGHVNHVITIMTLNSFTEFRNL